MAHSALPRSLLQLQALWINRASIAIQSACLQPAWKYTLAYSPTASLKVNKDGTLSGASAATNVPLTPSRTGLPPAEAARFPQLKGYAVLQLPSDIAPDTLQTILRSQIAVTAADPAGTLQYITGVQTAGVLDDLYFYGGALGLVFSRDSITITLWAPTAQSVTLLLFANGGDADPEEMIDMTASNGVWTERIPLAWKGKYYLYDVSVYVPAAGSIVRNRITDPYSLDLALNGAKTRITNPNDAATKPDGWDACAAPALESLNDYSIYELHVRDFSAADTSVPEEHRGTYLAFTQPGTAGMAHLQKLAQAGLKAVHLLPTYHFSSVDEDKATWQHPGPLSRDPPDGEWQQAAIEKVRSRNAYNWGYDPVHYLAPQGSYACNPDERVKEYRQMVQGLHGIGLRVVQDIVFNHTVAGGQTDKSVLDKIVPNYYFRLDPDGKVYTAAVPDACPDVASEHHMVEKLMIDTLVGNARHYKIDGYRFDLMGFHFVSNLTNIRHALSQLTLERDGVDGANIYLYGEGWEIGETAFGALGPNASQTNMHGTGIGTFNDRMRDAIRGGSPFGEMRLQGFATGLFTASSAFTGRHQPELAEQRALLCSQADCLRVALAGNLRDYTLTSSQGRTVRGGDLLFNGQPAGYAGAPIEVVNYCSVHDDQALFDAVQLKSAIQGTTLHEGDSIDMRTRRQVLAMSMLALAQGVPFFMAGDDLLRSKSMDHNSHDSGDWFNQIDWTGQTTNWGIGLPLASHNRDSWPIMRPLLSNPALAPTPAHVAHSANAFRMFLGIRYSSRLFRLATLGEVQRSLHFLNTGTDQVPAVIVMKLDANSGDYGPYGCIVVVFNATIATVDFKHAQLQGLGLKVHPLQAEAADPQTQAAYDAGTGTVTVSALTTAVFVSS